MRTWTDNDRAAALAKLREPFEHTEQLTKTWTDKETGEKRSVTLDYVGHANVTDRLLDVDPEWNWEPLAWTETGLPLFDLDDKGRPVGLWIKLTVAGVTRLGYGTVETNKSEPVKELIGDSIRNAGMRFGVALDLWKKHTDADLAGSSTRGRQAKQTGAASGGGKATQPQLGKIHATAKDREIGDNFLREIAKRKWPDSGGSLGELTKGQASELIDFLTKTADERLDELAKRYLGDDHPAGAEDRPAEQAPASEPEPAHA